MIKIKLRKNLLYLFVYYLSWYLRKIVDIIIESVFNSISAYIFLYLMTLGEIFGGLSIYLYQQNSSKQNKQTKYFQLKLTFYKKGIKTRTPDTRFKKTLLIFLASFFDFMEFIFASIHVPSVDPNISSTIDLRLGCITTIVSSLICKYALGLKTSKHHKFSLIMMSLCLVLIMILEIIYKQDNINFGRLFFARILVLMDLMCISMTDCTEKYLVNTNFLSPFKVMMFEGTFEFIMASLLSIGKAPFKELNQIYEDNSSGKFILLLFLLFLHLFFSAMVNSYKIYCNVIYSPMARSLMDYFMAPFFIIYYYNDGNDFQDNSFFFTISLIISIIIDFFSCVYNEYIILYCYDLELNTIYEISKRANSIDNFPKEFLLFQRTEDDDNIINNDDYITHVSAS
jgi:hypothetical protein